MSCHVMSCRRSRRRRRLTNRRAVVAALARTLLDRDLAPGEELVEHPEWEEKKRKRDKNMDAQSGVGDKRRHEFRNEKRAKKTNVRAFQPQTLQPQCRQNHTDTTKNKNANLGQQQQRQQRWRIRTHHIDETNSTCRGRHTNIGRELISTLPCRRTPTADAKAITGVWVSYIVKRINKK